MLAAGAILSLAMLSVATAASARPPDDADRMLAESQACLSRGGYADARQLLARVNSRPALTTGQRARLEQQLAAFDLQSGNEARAMAEADAAETAALKAQLCDVLARIESTRGMMWLYRGNTDEAIEHLQASAVWAGKSGDPNLISGAYARIAAAYQDRGDCTRALDAVNRSLDRSLSIDDAARLQALTRRGLIEAELHDANAAKADSHEALELARRTGDRRAESQVLNDLARTGERFDRDPAEAIAFAAQSASIAHDIQLPVLEIGALNQLGSLLAKAGRAEQARAVLEQALGLVNRYGLHRDEPYVLKNLGTALAKLGLTDQSKDAFRRAINRADIDNLTRVRWVARDELANLEAVDDPAAAEREYQDSLAIVEEQQTNVLLEGFRAGALDEKLAEFDPYDDYIRFLVRRGEPSRAFYVAERQRARAFLDTLSANRDALARAVPAGYAEKERAILQRIKSAQATLRSGGIADAQRAALVHDIGTEEERLSELRLRLAIDSPALAHARYPKLWQVSELQSKLLRDDEALLSVYLGSAQSVAWLITRQRLVAVALPPRREVEHAVRAAAAQLRDPLSRDPRSVVDLSRVLKIDAIANAAGARAHLIVVPYGILFDLPFEVLLDASGRPLVERFAISYAPSASSLAYLRLLAPPSSSKLTLLAVANPVVVQKTAAKNRQVDLAHVDLLTPVPRTLDEARGIARLFGARARVLEGAQATRTALLRSGIGEARILHFATHGLIDEIRPERSGLVLTADRTSDDGLLQARDVYALRLNAALVTLSGCETALGQNVTAEGILGLTRAFFYAGARSVVASLWDVDDDATAKFMRIFYADLRRGEPIDVALQRAKLEFIHGGGAEAAPFYWAAFVASGEARTAIDARAPLSPLPFVIALLAAAAAAACVWYMKSGPPTAR